jgi:hypothetical protein
MQILHSFFGSIFIMGIVFCGLTWMFSADRGLDILKRLGLALVLFYAATMFLPSAGTNLIEGGLRIVVAFTLFLAAVLSLVTPGGRAGTGWNASGIIATAIIVTIGIRLLWQEAPGVVMAVAGVAFFAIYFASGNDQH